MIVPLDNHKPLFTTLPLWPKNYNFVLNFSMVYHLQFCPCLRHDFPSIRAPLSWRCYILHDQITNIFHGYNSRNTLSSSIALGLSLLTPWHSMLAKLLFSRSIMLLSGWGCLLPNNLSRKEAIAWVKLALPKLHYPEAYLVVAQQSCILWKIWIIPFLRVELLVNFH